MLNEDNYSVATVESAVDAMDIEHRSEVIALSKIPKNDMVRVDSNETLTQICTSIKAGKLPEEAERAAVDILVALDVSYSMRRNTPASASK